ncbi:Protein CBG22441 [Caenorhabditis briggsae]|uniref:Protein CBG22441 n=1 Tax=Caenorhabditis briggsae TaxID=6238 RepID=A8Y2A7_CAEBR|nr:Protein CBG22441 [Caenorhabditis briggsae]CAP39027.2 Protein CBG22441 [Caenorhabditis briggsae]
MRKDIQCLRGIAILSVLLFHFAPTVFVNGFLGVDIFFVISGFLMAKSLSHSRISRVQDVLLFYYKRFRRILPLYYLAILLITLIVRLFLGDFLWKNNDRYSLASLFLVTNQLVIRDNGDYMNQFTTCLLITVFGFAAFFRALDRFAFHFMFLRLWQFSAGFCSLFWSKIQGSRLPGSDVTSKRSRAIVLISLLILSLCFFPREVFVLIARPLVTLVTAMIIACEESSAQIFKSETLVYIGDISYVLYLVHWPVISIFLPNNIMSYAVCIVAIFTASMTLHHYFEKLYLKLGIVGIFKLIVLLILANAYLQYTIRNDSFRKSNLPAGTRKIIDQNLKQSLSVWDLKARKQRCIETDIKTPFPKANLGGYCRYPVGTTKASIRCGKSIDQPPADPTKLISSAGSAVGRRSPIVDRLKWMPYSHNFQRGNGSISVMVLGNSYVVNLVEAMRAQFHSNYSEFRYMSVFANYGIYSGDTVDSEQALAFSKEQVEVNKPDVLFVIARYIENIKGPIQHKDPIVKQINETIAFYEKFVKKLYILDAHPRYHENFLDLFLHYVVTRPESLDSLHLDKKLADEEMRSVKERFAQIKCKKCEFFDLSHVFIKGDKYLTFDKDTLLTYADNAVHLTSAGVELCEPVFRKIAKGIMNGF